MSSIILLVNFAKERGFDVTCFCPLYINHVFILLRLTILSLMQKSPDMVGCTERVVEEWTCVI